MVRVEVRPQTLLEKETQEKDLLLTALRIVKGKPELKQIPDPSREEDFKLQALYGLESLITTAKMEIKYPEGSAAELDLATLERISHLKRMEKMRERAKLQIKAGFFNSGCFAKVLNCEHAEPSIETAGEIPDDLAIFIAETLLEELKRITPIKRIDDPGGLK